MMVGDVVQIGQVLAEKYRLVRLVGDGGMGAVYEAEHLLLGTRVAIKVIHPELLRRPGLADRFMQEARVSAQIGSPHVVSVHDVDRTAGGEAFLVMELLSGEPLSGRLDREKKLPEALACDLAIQILEALEAAHALGVVHRDLKPENVFLTKGTDRPFVKIIDFGIAKLRREGEKNLTQAGVMMGTAEYMAPEQAFSADKVDARADVYSVGVMLYEMLAGVRPVTGEDARIIALKVERGEATPLVHAAPGVRRELAGLVHRAIAAHLDVRFSSALEMRRALEALMGTPQISQAAQVPQLAAQPLVQGAPAVQKGTAMLSPHAHTPIQSHAQLVQTPMPAIANGANGANGPRPPSKGTALGAPVDPAILGTPSPYLAQTPPLQPGGYGAYDSHRYEPHDSHPDTHESRRKKGGSRAWMLVLPLIAGAAAVGIYVVYNNQTTTPTPAPLIAPTSTLTSLTSATPTSTTANGAQTPTSNSTSNGGTSTQTVTPPLGQTPPLRTPNGNPQVAPARPPQIPGQAPSAIPSGAPSQIPSAAEIPTAPNPFGFPSAIAMPSGMPPILIPSTFPTTFPPLVAPPATTPTP